MTQTNLNSTNLLFLILKWKKQLLYVAITAAVVSAIVSFLITPMYKASVALFPVRPGSVSKEIFNPTASGDRDILRFGEEDDSERMMEILNSEEIMNRLNKKYNLFSHYEIDPDSKYPKTLLKEEYKDNVSFKKTEFQSVQITVLDHSPDTAAMIANDIPEFLDSVIFEMQLKRAQMGFKIIEEEFLNKEKEIKLIEDSLNSLRKLGVQDYDLYTRQHAKALASGKREGAKAIENKLNELAKYSSIYFFMKERLMHETGKFTDLKRRYMEAKLDIRERLPQKFIVESASIPEKKYSPVRWLIVVVSTISSLLMGVLTIIGIENYNKITQIKK